MNGLEADLLFGPATIPKTFASSSMLELASNPEKLAAIAVRELIQNSLDAIVKRGDGVCGEVGFHIFEIEPDQIPGFETYKNRLYEAGEYWKKRSKEGSLRKGGKRNTDFVFEEIKRELSKEKIAVLMCIDNGIGLGHEQLVSILSDGDSSKEEGAGSYGVGHRAAFPCSALRYIVYGSKYHDSSSKLNCLLGGQAILATSVRQKKMTPNGISEPEVVSEEGIVVRKGSTVNPLALEEKEDMEFPSTFPLFAEEYLNKLTDTGTAVFILGFNDFLQEGNGQSDVIARVAAGHFSDAIHEEVLSVSVRDHRVKEGKQKAVTPDSLKNILQSFPRNLEAKKFANLNPEFALSAERTLREGREIEFEEDCLEGVRIRFRELSPQESQKSRVNVFRDGMWITSAAPQLQEGNFINYKPFDAVVSFYKGDANGLVRESEPPHHNRIVYKIIERKSEPKGEELRKILAAIQKVLQDTAPESESESNFRVSGFAHFFGGKERSANKLPQRIQGHDRTGGGLEPTPPNPDPPIRYQTVNVDYKYCARFGESRDKLEVELNKIDKKSSKHSILLRVFQKSGSDDACKSPVNDASFELFSITGDDLPDSQIFWNSSCCLVGDFQGTKHVSIQLCSEIESLEGIYVSLVKLSQSDADNLLQSRP